MQAQSVLLLKPASAHRLDGAPPRELTAGLSSQVSVRAAGRGHPWINLSDGRDLETRAPAGALPAQETDRDSADPASLASGDFNEDGSPDLVVGYSVDRSRGMIILHRGNIAAIYPSVYDKSPGSDEDRKSVV